MDVIERLGWIIGVGTTVGPNTIETCVDARLEITTARARIAELGRVMTLAKDLIVSGYAMEAAAELERALEPTPVHASDCALHNEPAIPVGPCDCGEEKSKT